MCLVQEKLRERDKVSCDFLRNTMEVQYCGDAQILFNPGADTLLQPKDDLLSLADQTGLLRLRVCSTIRNIHRGVNESNRRDVGGSLP